MLSLEPTTEDDFEYLIRWAESPAFLVQWAGGVFSYPLDEGQLGDHVYDSGPDRRTFTAVDETDEPVGYIELNDVDRDNDSASLARVVVAPDRRGEGVGAEMVREALRVGFDEEGLHRIDLRVFDFNEAAIACYESVGFRHEGRLREAIKHDDEYWTMLVMGILEDEWTGENAD